MEKRQHDIKMAKQRTLVLKNMAKQNNMAEKDFNKFRQKFFMTS